MGLSGLRWIVIFPNGHNWGVLTVTNHFFSKATMEGTKGHAGIITSILNPGLQNSLRAFTKPENLGGVLKLPIGLIQFDLQVLSHQPCTSHPAIVGNQQLVSAETSEKSIHLQPLPIFPTSSLPL